MPDRTCTIDGCDRKHYGRGWCGVHYQRWWNHGDPLLVKPQHRVRSKGAVCAVDDCEGDASANGAARGWCGKHYGRWQRTGDPLKVRKSQGNRGPRNVPPRAPCEVDGCATTSVHVGLCVKHYGRWRRHGTTGPTKPWIDLPDGLKWCTGHQEARPVDEFPPSGGSYCSACSAEVSQRWAERNRERRRASYRAYYESHAEQRRAGTRAWRENNPRKAAAARRRRKALERAVRVEDFTDAEIFERDGWICQLCRKRIDRSAPWPKPRSPSIDHIVPLSCGGDHSRTNVQAAHLRCNLKKQAGGTDQLRLIG